ncbi:MAG: class I SAM-dependent methyltransferase [Pseudomonadota bacterium]|nr:class I SAM-dependent methyltransferase [Pseudomonadota bacterium]
MAELLLPLDTPPIEIETEVDAEGLARLLAHTEAVWTRLGTDEPHWSVLSAERFRQGELEPYLAEFFDSGAGDLALFKAFLARNGVDPASLSKVLEYGCGLGRVTRFLAGDFAKVEAFDISPSHLQQAEAHLQRNGVANVELRRITVIDDIGTAADLDAVFCVIVLQHNPPPVMVAVLQRLLARLRPGCVAYFQVPTHAVGYGFKLDAYLAHGLDATHIEMHYLPQRRVFQLAHEARCDVLEVREDNWVGRRDLELSNTFLLRKRDSSPGSSTS